MAYSAEFPELATPEGLRQRSDDRVSPDAERWRRLYETVLSNTPDLVYVFDLNHRFIYANNALLRIWGKTWNDAIGKNCLELGYEPWHAAMHDREIEQVVATRQPVRGEVPFTGTFGRRIYEYIFVPVLAPDGGVEAIAGTTRDVTVRKQSEDALRQSEQRFRAFVSSTADVIYSMSPDWKEMRYLEGKDFIPDTSDPSRTWLDKYIHPDDQARVLSAIEAAIRAKGVFQLEHRVIRVDGSLGWTFSRAVPIFSPAGVIVEWFGAAADVTRRKLAEEAVVKSEKLAAMGRLAGTIAHEIGNPVETALGAAFLLKENSSLNDDAKNLVGILERELGCVAHIAKQSLGFYRESSNPVALRLASVLDEVLQLLEKRTEANGVRILRKYSANGELLSFPGEMRQVFLNLIRNAIEATAAGGIVRIHLHRSQEWNGTRSGFRVSVSDTGIGVSAETGKKLFEPFFSTKDEKGTGLGLWVTKGIIQKHEGSIRFRTLRKSAGGSVTCFTVFLPEFATAMNAPFAA